MFLFGLGFALVVSVAITNTLLQKLVTDQMRGRVMSMFILSFMGTMPIGNILAGAASNQFGPQHTLAVGGFVVTLVATGVAIFNKRCENCIRQSADYARTIRRAAVLSSSNVLSANWRLLCDSEPQ